MAEQVSWQKHDPMYRQTGSHTTQSLCLVLSDPPYNAQTLQREPYQLTLNDTDGLGLSRPTAQKNLVIQCTVKGCVKTGCRPDVPPSKESSEQVEGAGKCLWLVVQKTEWITFSVAGYREVIISLEIWMWCMLWYGFFCRIIGWLRANRVGMVIYMHTYFFSLVLGRDFIFFFIPLMGMGWREWVLSPPSTYLFLPPPFHPPSCTSSNSLCKWIYRKFWLFFLSFAFSSLLILTLADAKILKTVLRSEEEFSKVRRTKLCLTGILLKGTFGKRRQCGGKS